MFIGVYFALCSFQYLIVMIASIVLLGKTAENGVQGRFLARYSLWAAGISLLGLILFTFLSIPLGNLHIQFPQDLSGPAQLLRSLAVILVILLGLAGVTAPVWTLLLVKPRAQRDQQPEG